MFFELGVSLAARTCRDYDCEDCFDKLIELQMKVDALPNLVDSLPLQEEVINNFPQLWKKNA